MEKLLLVSLFQNVTGLLRQVEPDLKGKSVTYIPTASRVERRGFLARMSRWVLRSMGLRVDAIDVSTALYEAMRRAFERNDLVFVVGGNTFYLLQELRKSGADELLREAVHAGKLYIGESAGAIVAAPDIAYSRAMDRPDRAPDLHDTVGLGLVDFYPVPHANNRELGPAAERIVREHAGALDVRPFDDKQALYVENGAVRVLDA